MIGAMVGVLRYTPEIIEENVVEAAGVELLGRRHAEPQHCGISRQGKGRRRITSFRSVSSCSPDSCLVGHEMVTGGGVIATVRGGRRSFDRQGTDGRVR